MNTAKLLFLLIFAYLLGSVPFAYLIGRLVKGIDIRQYGSGTVGSSMVYEHVTRWLVVPVGLLDIAKAALPTYLGLRLGFGEPGAVAAGMVALVGHNWPIYLGFTGGRGMTAILGTLLVLFPWGDIWFLTFLAIGFLLGDSAPWALTSLVSMLFLVRALGGSDLLYILISASLVIMLIKRLEANLRPLPKAGHERWKVIGLRLFFDRDIAGHKAWIRRRAGNTTDKPQIDTDTHT